MKAVTSFFALTLFVLPIIGLADPFESKDCEESDIVLDPNALQVKKVSGSLDFLTLHFDFPSVIEDAKFEYLYLEDVGEDGAIQFSTLLSTWPVDGRLEATVMGTESAIQQYSLAAIYLGKTQDGKCGVLARLNLADNPAVHKYLECLEKNDWWKCNMPSNIEGEELHE